jgi:REP element-mobilizing transposase RayT
MPDHWHGLIVPADDDTLPQVMNAVKVASMRRINSRRGMRGALWQPRYFDEII